MQPLDKLIDSEKVKKGVGDVATEESGGIPKLLEDDEKANEQKPPVTEDVDSKNRNV